MKSKAFFLVLVSLMAALVAVGSVFSIPVPFLPPVTLAVFFALLSGLLLGPLWGGAALGLFLLMGSLGLPVFQNGAGGFGHFKTPTGGFLLGYLGAAVTAGLLADRKKWSFPRALLGAFAGVIVLYLIGLPWFRSGYSIKKGIDLSLWKAFLIMAPYLVGDVLKAIVAAALIRGLKPLLINYAPLNASIPATATDPSGKQN